MQYLKEKLEKDILFIDELTGIFNRRFFERILPRLLKNAKRCTFAIFDVDDFKKINDTYGHRTGDKVLKKVGESLKSLFAEKIEFPIRYAGDEFAVAIMETEKDEALKKIREMFTRISNTEVEENGKKIKISISCGVSFFPEDALSHEELLTKADEGLYYVKKRGKNNFVVYKDVIKLIEKEKILKSLLTPKEFVNYEEEKEIINAGIERGKGIFVITGPSGTGKTRLLKLIEQKCKENEFFTIICFTIKSDRNLPFNSLLRGINTWLDEERIIILEENGLGRYLEYFPFFKKGYKEEINVEEIFDFLEQFTSKFKVCFLIDDGENLDRYSSEFIEMSKEKSLFSLSVQDLKFLNPSLIEKSLLISLTHLPPPLIKEYVKAILPDFEHPPEFTQWITKLSEGNPFLIEEILRYLLEKEYIVFSEGNLKLSRFEEISSKKPSIIEITKERLKTLDKETKVLLYSLSIGEKYFDLQTAAAYGGINPGRMMEIIEKLIEKQFISRVSEEIYCFRNLTVKDMIYKGMEENIRKKLHYRMAKAMETSRYIPSFITSLERAKHYRIAGEIQKAKELTEKINSFLKKLQTIPDLKRLKKLKKKKRLQTQLRFNPLKNEMLGSVDIFLRRFYGAIEGVKIYPPSSSVVRERIKQTYEILEKILMVQKSLIMGVHGGKLIINESEIPENKVYIKRIKEFLDETGLESLIFTQEVNEEDFRKFIFLTKEMKEMLTKGVSIEEMVDNMNLKGIFANERVYVALGSEYSDIGEWELIDTEGMETFSEKITPPFAEVQEEKKRESDHELNLILKNEEKLKQYIGKMLLDLDSHLLEKQKKSIKVLEEIYKKTSSEIKSHIAEKITEFYFQKAPPDLKDFLREKIWIYIQNLVQEKPEKIISIIEKNPEFIKENLWKLIEQMEKVQEGENKEKFKNFLVEKGIQNFKELVIKCKKEYINNPLFQEIIAHKIRETRGKMLNLLKDKDIIIKALEIMEKENIDVDEEELLNLYLKNPVKEISQKIFHLIMEKKPEIMLMTFDTLIKQKNYEKIKNFLQVLEKEPDRRFLPFLFKIIEKKNKFVREFPYDIQMKVLNILKKLDLSENIVELVDIAKREKFFSLKRNKEIFFRVELIKLLYNYREEEIVANFLKLMERDKTPAIKVLIKNLMQAKNEGEK